MISEKKELIEKVKSLEIEKEKYKATCENFLDKKNKIKLELISVKDKYKKELEKIRNNREEIKSENNRHTRLIE